MRPASASHLTPQPPPSLHLWALPSPPPVAAVSRGAVRGRQHPASGRETSKIAENLVGGPITARNHITHVVSKLGARNRLQAVLYASRRRLI